MANTKRKSSGSRSGGNTLFAMLAGLIIGLALAAAVATFVMRAPMPFVDHATREPAKTALLPNVKDAPDPNLGLYGADGGAGTLPQGGPVNTAPKPLPGNAPHGAPAPAANDNISKLIATLTDTSKPAPAQGAAPAAPARAPSSGHSAAATQPKPAAAAPGTQTVYYLQAGSFHSSSEAEAVKARILMLGLPVAVQKAQVNGTTVNRVRVGPFKGIDEMNRSRTRLGEEKIASTVVRQ
ncbi:SPOR domain-containing protein [Candidimonas nitroreducens]|uniref:Cell division protein n=1 Tax=Candidimonas nitroreducens TaxID=683354 RepID=A0A225MUG3_9BURK|nr:SPOR domain-containing protein [Candidimonas nitroreducens]OWT63490.1 cell division protein [Candidimonas nitroreducens]